MSGANPVTNEDHPNQTGGHRLGHYGPGGHRRYRRRIWSFGFGSILAQGADRELGLADQAGSYRLYGRRNGCPRRTQRQDIPFLLRNPTQRRKR